MGAEISNSKLWNEAQIKLKTKWLSLLKSYVGESLFYPSLEGAIDPYIQRK